MPPGAAAPPVGPATLSSAAGEVAYEAGAPVEGDAGSADFCEAAPQPTMKTTTKPSPMTFRMSLEREGSPEAYTRRKNPIRLVG